MFIHCLKGRTPSLFKCSSGPSLGLSAFPFAPCFLPLFLLFLKVSGREGRSPPAGARGVLASLPSSQHHQNNPQRCDTIIQHVQQYTRPDRLCTPAEEGERQPDDEQYRK